MSDENVMREQLASEDDDSMSEEDTDVHERVYSEMTINGPDHLARQFAEIDSETGHMRLVIE